MDLLIPLFERNNMLPIVFAADLLCGFLNTANLGDGSKDSLDTIEILNKEFFRKYGYALIWMGNPDE